MNGVLSGRQDRLAQAIKEVECLLERSATHYPDGLPPEQYVRLADWAGLRPSDSGLVMQFPEQFARLDPTRQHLEVGRCHAEALLISERLCEAMLTTPQREELTQRALGILPDSEAGRFLEILACPDLKPRKIANSAPLLLRAVEDLEKNFGWSTALAYGQLVVAGLRTEEEFSRYGQRLDHLFNQIISSRAVAQWLTPPRPEETTEKHELLHGLLWHARDALWRVRPDRVSTPFLLTQVIDGYMSDRGGVGNSLGLAMLDSIVIGRLGFRPHFLLCDGVISLEVPVAAHTAHWSVVDPEPLSDDRPPGARRLDTAEIFAFTYASLATAHSGRGMWDRAMEAYARALELKPDSVDVLTSRAVCHLRREMPGDAVSTLRRVIEIAPDSAEAYHQLGNAYTMMSDWPRALDAFRHAVKLRPDGADIYNNMGIAYMRAGDLGQATAAFETALEVKPDYYQAHFNLGNLYLGTKDHDRAIRHYRDAVRIEPGFVPAYYNMGQACYNKGDLDGAIHSYQRALDLNPKHFGAWHNLGIAFRDKGMTQKAVEALEKAVAINPNLLR